MKKVVVFNNGINSDLLKDDLITPIEKFVNSLEFIELEKLEVGIIFNKKFSNFNKEFENDKFEIFEFNTPSSIDGKDYNQIRNLIKELQKILLSQNQIKLEESEVNSISIMLLFNKGFEDIHIKGLKMDKKEEKKEEMNFIPTIPKYKLSQVIMPKELEKEIKKTLTILESRELIYDKWGFSEIEPAPKAILNFYGPPGTGKTMTAQAIADYLGVKIMALNYADIESKYVGDAPKNLVKAFEIAQKEKALLFFDEADSFLGKRISNVSSSSDQAVNSLRSQLLILLENFEGIVIFATNLIKNYDKAFESRIFKHLKFDLPDENHRKLIIEKSIPQKVPFENNQRLNEVQLTELAKITEGLSGRYIKNGILNALTNAVLEKREYVTYQDFKESCENLAKTIKDIKEDSNHNSVNLDPKKKKELEKKIAEKLKEGKVNK